jgi:hypothetical protein
MRTFLLASAVVLGIGISLSAQYGPGKNLWLEQSSKEELPEFNPFDNSNGKMGVLNASGTVKTEGHPFFTPLGTNGRACINCHQPAWGMSVSADGLAERWRMTNGKDPVFAAFDGSNCPSLPQEQQSSHSLLLKRGLIRIPISWPPKNGAEFTIEVVNDPTGCNTSAEYGLKSGQISVYRRPRPVANLKYVVSGGRPVVLKTGTLADLDPETGQPVAMNLMSDAREASLKTQAMSAIMGHEQAKVAPTREQIEKIVEFESQVYVAQQSHIFAGALAVPGGPSALGVAAMRDRKAGVLGDNDYDSVFGSFGEWKNGGNFYQSSVARGADIFMYRQFWLRDAAHINSIGLGNPLKRTCATCHNSQMTGQDLSAGWVDVGTTTFPTWSEPAQMEKSELPVFKVTCAKTADPHPYLGRVIYTTDPGRALISGKCSDVGSIVMQQLRGLSARAPYFANGSAKSLREVVDFYDRRFDMKLSDVEKEDLINFLGAL